MQCNKCFKMFFKIKFCGFVQKEQRTRNVQGNFFWQLIATETMYLLNPMKLSEIREPNKHNGNA